MKFLHAADIHLDSALHGLQRYEGAPVDEIRGATRRAFDNLIELAITEQVAFVLLAGDLFDRDWKDYNSGLYFVGCLRKLEQAGIRVFMIAGNHDAASQISRKLRLPDNVTEFSTSKPQQVLLDDLGVAIVGQGFATRAVTDDLSAAYPQADPQLFTIGLLHPGKAVIQLSLRYKTNDHLWFTFFHEAGHILLHGKNDVFLEGGNGIDEAKEAQANEFAQQELIPRCAFAEFLRQPRFSKAIITTFAESIGIAVGIVVGQLQHHDRLPMTHCNDLKVVCRWEHEHENRR